MAELVVEIVTVMTHSLLVDKRSCMNPDAIFINCPFDNKYKPMLRAMLFVARFYGLEVKIASSDTDSKSNRLERIIELMKESKYSIHDLSKLKSEKRKEYYRMNMPFELGLDYGIGGKEMIFLIFEDEAYKLKIALSDINGWDVRPHNNKPEQLILEFRKWIVVNRDLPESKKVLSSSDIWYIYNDFYARYSDYMDAHRLKDEEVSVSEYISLVDKFLATYTWE